VKIELRTVKVSELIAGDEDSGEEGVRGGRFADPHPRSLRSRSLPLSLRSKGRAAS